MTINPDGGPLFPLRVERARLFRAQKGRPDQSQDRHAHERGRCPAGYDQLALGAGAAHCLYRVMRVTWRWRFTAAALVVACFFIVDLAFFASNALKIAEGGWVPLLVGAAIFAIMTTWRDGLAAYSFLISLSQFDPSGGSLQPPSH